MNQHGGQRLPQLSSHSRPSDHARLVVAVLLAQLDWQVVLPDPDALMIRRIVLTVELESVPRLGVAGSAGPPCPS